MTLLLHELVATTAARTADASALIDGKRELDYAALQGAIERFSAGLVAAGVGRQDRVAVYLPKTLEAVISMFGAARAGCVFVPVNPVLKPAQVEHIMRDSGATVLVTSDGRLRQLDDVLATLPSLAHVVVSDNKDGPHGDSYRRHGFDTFCAHATTAGHRVIDTDVAAILYTSGSTGKPKGVVLSHRNMVTGAFSVAEYLENTAADRLLAVLPFSFDYGFSQLSTAFRAGGCVVLMEYLLPRDVIRKVAAQRITGLACVPPLWNQLADLEWPAGSADTLRYFTNSGGAMPKATLAKLRAHMPNAKPYLMYGLTEAFRSTYLPPDQVDVRPESMGKAIPNAEILIVNEHGKPCAPGEIGELVHRGSLVSLGYWNNIEKTNERFKPLAAATAGCVLQEIAVWSGDSVRSDDEGFLYFVGRRDEMIKTNGYRVSPAEIEEVIYDAGLAKDVIAMGVAHPQIGQAIVVVASSQDGRDGDSDGILAICRAQLANFMLPHKIIWLDALPRNPNGKIDRSALAQRYKDLFATEQ